MYKWPNEMNIQFSKEVQMANKNNKMLNILDNERNSYQNDIEISLTPVSMVAINNTNNNKC
jgi:hypothetical protein